MDRNEKLALVQAYRDGLGAIERKIDGLDAAALDFIPPVPDAWSIKAHLVHVLDAEMYAWPRIRKAIAQSGAGIDVWDQEAWAAALDYASEDPAAVLALLRAVRSFLGAFLERRIDEDWERYRVLHPERGELTLPKIVKIYVDHVDFHLNYIDRNLKALAEKK